MSKTIVYNIAVCIDCVMIRENGESEGINDDRQEELWQYYPNFGDVSLNMQYDDNGEITGGYSDFSWTPCDACGSALGGSRHTYAVWG